jgi:hypothetical protein
VYIDRQAIETLALADSEALSVTQDVNEYESLAATA